MTTKQTKHPLIGRAFHTVDECRRTDWQGVFSADCGNGFILVQLYDWICGGPNTQNVISMAEIGKKHLTGWQRFRIFTELEDANHYIDHTARHRDRHIDEEAAGKAPE
jgi:hypothetical protein